MEEKKEFSEYTNYISLGYFCSVAQELERTGFRCASYPFDWLISDFKGIIGAIKNNFEDFLTYDFLCQNITDRSHYRNTKIGVSFFHDFDKYRSLEKQLPSVQEKYNRRINRFYHDICQPTLFIRYISDEKKENNRSAELQWIENNYEEIMRIIKSYNPNNAIIWIANEGVTSDIIDVYHVIPDDNDIVARKPFQKNNQLMTLFDSLPYDKKEENLRRFYAKTNSKNGIFYKFRKKIGQKRKMMFCKEYVHNKQYESDI